MRRFTILWSFTNKNHFHMKRRILIISAVCLSLATVRCTKDEVSKTVAEASAERTFTHHYHYQDEVYNVELTFNQDHEVTKATGDVMEYKQLFSDKSNQPKAYLISENDENGAEIYVFKTVEEMNKSSIAAAQSNVGSNQLKSCDDWSNPGQGTANYTFYQDVNYVNEFTYLSQWMVSYFQVGTVGAANDQISSFALWGTAGESIDIFEDNCFGGNTKRFYGSVPNLHNFYFIWVVDVIRDPVTGLFTTNEYPAGHWGDKVSSIKGWSY